MWKKTLEIEDRIALRGLLLQCKGSYSELCLAEKLIDSVLSVEHIKQLKLREEAGMILYNTVDDKGKPLSLSVDVEFGPEGRGLVTRNLMMLEEAGMLERSQKHLFEVFVKTPWPDPES